MTGFQKYESASVESVASEPLVPAAITIIARVCLRRLTHKKAANQAERIAQPKLLPVAPKEPIRSNGGGSLGGLLTMKHLLDLLRPLVSPQKLVKICEVRSVTPCPWSYLLPIFFGLNFVVDVVLQAGSHYACVFFKS